MTRFKSMEDVKARQVGLGDRPQSVFGVDPGNIYSAWAKFDIASNRYLGGGKELNASVLERLLNLNELSRECRPPVWIEKIESYGMPVGGEIFDTVFWSGRYYQACLGPVFMIGRKSIKASLCGTTRSGDPQVRAALIQLLGEPGTKKNPGPLYGVHADIWAALAVAVFAARQYQ